MRKNRTVRPLPEALLRRYNGLSTLDLRSLPHDETGRREFLRELDRFLDCLA